MSVHYSRFSLNVYPETAYFQAHLPQGYPLPFVLQKSRMFRKLPPNLKKLGELSKQWAKDHTPNLLNNGIKEFYDEVGNELDPETGKRLTDSEINAVWDAMPPNPALDNFIVKDVPGSFPNPATWKPPVVKIERDAPPPQERLLSEVRSFGKKRVSEAYDIPEDQLPDVPAEPALNAEESALVAGAMIQAQKKKNPKAVQRIAKLPPAAVRAAIKKGSAAKDKK